MPSSVSIMKTVGKIRFKEAESQSNKLPIDLLDSRSGNKIESEEKVLADNGMENRGVERLGLGVVEPIMEVTTPLESSQPRLNEEI